MVTIPCIMQLHTKSATFARLYTQIFHTSRILPPNSAILLISLFSSFFVAKIKNRLTCKFSIEYWPMHILYVPAGLPFKKSYCVLQKGINSSFYFVNSIYVLKLASRGEEGMYLQVCTCHSWHLCHHDMLV